MSRLIESGTTDGVGFGNADETDAPLNVAGEFNVAGTLNLDQALGISGVVLDDSQAPIQDATIGVTLTENGEDVIYDTTDANGEYAFTEHTDGDSTKQEWHVTAALNDNGDLFNAESKPFVRATLTPTIIQATGGDAVQDVTLNGIDFRIHAFTAVGSQSFEVTDAPSQNDTVDVLLVGGGGGGGTSEGAGASGAGGGAGGVVFTQQQVSEGVFNIAVGDGGAGGAASTDDPGDTGDNTTALGLTALGGGGGGGRNGSSQAPAKDGGSGGGEGSQTDPRGSEIGEALQPTSVDGGFGHDGGKGDGGGSGDNSSGGGGGAAFSGKDAVFRDFGGDGGDGLDFSAEFTNQFGDNGFFGGGGGGGIATSDSSNRTAGSGGIGGGGDGGRGANSVLDAPDNGTPNTGGGGGGAGGDNSATGGDGGSGIVLIRYEI